MCLGMWLPRILDTSFRNKSTKAGSAAGSRAQVNFALSPNGVFPFSGHEDVRTASEQPPVQLLALPLCLSLKYSSVG